jgi:hypothetical protein
MSVDAEIAVLFTAPRSEVDVPLVADGTIVGFSIIEDANLHCWGKQMVRSANRTFFNYLNGNCQFGDFCLIRTFSRALEISAKA